MLFADRVWFDALVTGLGIVLLFSAVAAIAALSTWRLVAGPHTSRPATELTTDHADMPSRMPNEHWFALTEASVALPSTAPAPLRRIMTGLWLIPDYGKFIVSWMNVQGWRKRDLLS